LDLEDLEEKVQIYRDKWGMPHIYAQSSQDLFLALGFAMAQDRFNQMEGWRRTFRGELSAVLGARSLRMGDLPLLLKENTLVGADQFMRCLDLLGTARESWKLHSAETQACLKAFSQGVNHFLRQGHGLPLELRLPGLRYRPSEWEPVDCLLVMKGFAFFMNHAWKAILSLERLRHGMPGDERKTHVFWPRNGMEDAFSSASGSNAWILSPNKTSLGSTMLCNDPHLLAQCPCPLYPCHLSCDTFHGVGMALPGIPGILLGHNEQIAWGVADAMGHCSDLFQETIHDRDPLLVLEANEWQPVVWQASLIEIKNDRTRAWNIRRTKRGPILSDVIETGLPGDFSLKWTGFEPSRDLDGLLGLLSAHDFPSFRETLRLLSVPTLNVAYADVEGNIGSQSAGLHPSRRARKQPGVLNALRPSDAWNGFLPFDSLPNSFNPSSGQIVLANQRPTPSDTRQPPPGFYCSFHRANRIEQKLNSKDDWDVPASQRLQADVICTQAQGLIQDFFRPFALRHPNLSPDSTRLLRGIIDWDASCHTESPGCLQYHAFFHFFRIALLGRFHGQGQGALYLEYLSSPGDPIVSLLREPVASVLDENARDTLVLCSLEDAHRWLCHKISPNPKKWQWGCLHKARHRHAFTGVPILGPFFDVGPSPSPGAPNTINRADFLEREPFVQRTGASARLIMVPGQWERSSYICSTGVSGHVASPHYDDMFDLWLQGRLLPLSFHSHRIFQGDLLQLNPTNGVRR